MRWIIKILEIEPFTITCLWNNQEVRVIDLTQFISIKSLSTKNSYFQLKDKKRFSEAKCDGTTIYWENGIKIKDINGKEIPGPLDIDPEILFEMSVSIEEKISAT
jgi:hypothetical protein